MVGYDPDAPGYFYQPGELCQSCRRLRSTGGCLAIAILSSPWARFIAAPYSDDPSGAKRARLLDEMQADTDAAEGYRRGETEFCEAYRSRDSAPADEGRGTLINLDSEEE